MFSPSTVVTSIGAFPSITNKNTTHAKSTQSIFSLELAPWELPPLKPLLSDESYQYQTQLSSPHHKAQATSSPIIHGPCDAKRTKHNSGKAIIPSTAQVSQCITGSTGTTTTEQAVLLSIGQSTHSVHQSSFHNHSRIKHTSTKPVSNPQRKIKHVPKTPNNEYIVISVSCSIPTDNSTGRGRKCKIHHRRNDKLCKLIDFLIDNKNIDMFGNSNTRWRDKMYVRNGKKELCESQRDLLKCLDGILNKFSNNDVAGILTSYLTLQKNKDIRSQLQSELQAPEQQQLPNLLSNLSECANDTVHHNKYKLVMPIVPVLSYKTAKANGFHVGYRCWKRANKLYKQSNDVTIKIKRHSKVCVQFPLFCIGSVE